MTGSEDNSYKEGLRDGKIVSLEASVSELTKDVKQLKTAIFMLYGAIGLVQFLPELRRLFGVE